MEARGVLWWRFVAIYDKEVNNILMVIKNQLSLQNIKQVLVNKFIPELYTIFYSFYYIISNERSLKACD